MQKLTFHRLFIIVLLLLGMQNAFAAPPVLDAIATPQIIVIGDTLTFTVKATDPDGDNLTFSLKNDEPSGATIDANSGAFSWTPSSTGTFSATIKVMDDGSPNLSDEQTISLFVSAIRPGFNTTDFPANDDGSVAANLGFTVNYFGSNYSDVYVNNNGNFTFGNSLGVFSASPLNSAGLKIIAAFWADLDTRGNGSGIVKYATGTVNGRSAFGATWIDVGYYNSNTDKLNSFQIILVDRSDIAVGDFDIELNYSKVLWESDDSNGGTDGLGGNSARVGYSDGADVNFELPGSGVNGALIDGGSNALISNSHNSEVAGRYYFPVRNGDINNPPVLDAIATPQTVTVGNLLTFTATATDPDGDTLRFDLENNNATGSTIDANSGVFNWTPSSIGSFSVTVKVTDDGSPSQYDTQAVNITVGTICQTQTEIPEIECNTLVALYDNTDGANWFDSATNNWTKTNTPCSWEGVTCSGGNVAVILREDKNLNGSLPDLSALTSLQQLRLFNNKLSGNIPDLSALTSLTVLYLYENQLTGNIPDLSALKNLIALALFDNQLNGSIPDLSALTKVTTLFLYNNQLTGGIPDLSVLTSLQQLKLQKNQLTGNIPDLSKLTDLQSLNLSYNQLSGDIPASLASLSKLSAPNLDLANNQLTASDSDVISFLNTNDSDWADTQTVAVTNLTATATAIDTISLTWTAIKYTGDDGYYIIKYGTQAGGSYNTSINTTNKQISSYDVSNLSSSTKYYFIIETYTPAHGDQQNDLTVASSEVSATTLTKKADLQITKTDSTDPIEFGKELTYTLTVKNNGPYEATNIKVVDTLPTEATFVSASGTDWTCNENSGTVTCTLNTLANDSTANVIEIKVKFSSTTGTFTNGATVSSDTVDSDDTNNSANEETSVKKPNPGNQLPVLNSISNKFLVFGNTLTLTATASDPDEGDKLTFDLVNSPSSATIDSNTGKLSFKPENTGIFSITVRVTDDSIPAGSDEKTFKVEVVAGSLNDSAPASEPEPEPEPEPENNPPQLGSISNKSVGLGETLKFTVSASDPDGDSLSFSLVNAPSGANLNNSEFVWTANSVGTFPVIIKVTDSGSPSLSDTESFEITVTSSIDLSITNKESVDSVMPGDNLSYTLTIKNNSANEAQNIIVTDTLAPEVDFVSADGGNDWQCKHNLDTVTCKLASLAANETAEPIIIEVTVLATATDSVSNTAKVESIDSTDPDSSNNTANEETSIAQFTALTTEIKPANSGSITIDPDKVSYNLNENVNIKAIPNSECYEFSHWEGACDGSGEECSLVMDSNKNTIAHFKPKAVTLNISAENGSVTIEPKKGEYLCDDQVIFTAMPNQSYQFLGWSGDVSGKQDKLSLVFRKPEMNIEAIFGPLSTLAITPNQVHSKLDKTLQFTASGGNGNFFWAATGGELTENGNTATYKVTKEGVFYIWVSDGFGFAWSLVDSSSVKDATVLLRLNPSRLNLAVGDTQAISAQAYKGDGSSKNVLGDVLLEIENSEIAQVTQKGHITARAVGKTKLIGTYQNHTAEVIVTVEQQQQDVLQVEPEILILSEGEKSAVKVYFVSKTGRKTIIEDAVLTSKDINIATVSNNIVTGVAKGSSSLQVSVGDANTAIPVVVRSIAPLSITPSNVTLEKGKTIEFSINGGKSPYEMTASKGAVNAKSANTFIYSSEQSGDDISLTVTDKDGNQVQATVNVVEPLTVTPTRAIVTTQEVVKLTASGGYGDYVWTYTQGEADRQDGDTINYTAPNVSGWHTVTVRDELANNQQVLILVGNELSLSEEQLFLVPEDSVELNVLGGVAPYTVNVSAGKADVRSNVITYTAPKVAGNYSLTVSDKSGNKVSVEIKIALDLLVTPRSSRVDAGESLTLYAAGGFGTKRWVASKGELDKTDGETVTWTAPNNFGPTAVYVTDEAGATATANLEIASTGFAVTPSVRHVLPGEKVDFIAVGGANPYTWKVEVGDTDNSSDETMTYQAPKVKGSYKVEVTDNSGKTAVAQVNVFSKKLFASPKTLYINRGDSLPITIGGGTGKYTVRSTFTGLNQILQLEDKLSIKTEYTAPKNYEGRDTIHILDTAGNLVSINVEIAKKDDILDIYAGADGKIDDAEMDKAIDDFFAGQAWLDRTVMFEIAEQFVVE